MEWNKLWGNTEVIWTDGALIPVYRLSEEEIVLIDTGAKEEPELLAELDRQNLRVRAILCTHLHPDHIANNEAILRRDGAEVFAAQRELDNVEESYERLRKAAVQLGISCPEPNHPITAIGEGDSVELDGVSFGLLPTPGHTPGHLAFVTPDGVCCLGDAMISPDQLRASRLPYLEDIDMSIATMERLRQTRYPLYLTAHRGITRPEELPGLVEMNVRKELELYEILRRTITGPMELEAVVTNFMESIGLRPKAVESPLMRYTAEKRVHALVNAGEYRSENGWICPR